MTIDVSDILCDPDFTTPGGITVKRTIQTVDDNGVAQSTFSYIKGITAVVEPNSTMDVIRTAEGVRLLGSIAVYAKFEFYDGGQDDAGNQYAADIVLWNGKAWAVMADEDWHFGQNYHKAICTILQLNPEVDE